MKIKIICCDVDGTLINTQKQITKRTIEIIKKVVQEKNIKFVIVSGRMLSGIRGFYTTLGIKGPVSAYNGCALYDEKDNLIADHRLEKEVTDIVIATAHKFGLDLIFYDNLDWYMENTACYTFKKKYPLYFNSCKIENLNVLSAKKKTNKLLTMDADGSKLKIFEEKLRLQGIDEKKVFFYRGEDFLEIMPAPYTKGTAIEDLKKYYGIEKEQIMAIGDDFNDIPMLDAAGFSVAMANAYEEVKLHADFVTKTNEEDGVAFALEKYCL